SGRGTRSWPRDGRRVLPRHRATCAIRLHVAFDQSALRDPERRGGEVSRHLGRRLDKEAFVTLYVALDGPGDPHVRATDGALNRTAWADHDVAADGYITADFAEDLQRPCAVDIAANDRRL